MSDQYMTPDQQAQEQAHPTEQQEIRNDPFTGANHASLPGVPANEPYMIGDELNRIGQGQFSRGVNLGGLDAANLYPVSNPFPDQQPAYDASGFDSMRGINSGIVNSDMTMSNERMYWFRGSGPLTRDAARLDPLNEAEYNYPANWPETGNE